MNLNGKTEGNRESNEGDLLDWKRGLGVSGDNSSINGTGEIKVTQADCSQRDSPGRNFSPERETPVGKALQRLELIEIEYLSYLNDHQERLETRLNESRSKEEGFKKAVRELKQEIYILSTQKTE
jgi:hypothetical protein